LIIIDGGGAGVADALTLDTGSSNSTIRGLVINDCTNGNGITIRGGINHVIAGNFIGTSATGGAPVGANGANGLLVQAAVGANVSGTRVGGSAAADRNVISGNALRNVWIANQGGTANNILVQGNYIGTNSAGTASRGGIGLQLDALTNATIGGASSSLGGSCTGVCNLISGNTGQGLAMNTSGTYVIQGNFIGTNVTGTAALGNGNGAQSAVEANGVGSLTIGGVVAGTGNLISGQAVSRPGITIDLGVAGPVTIQGNYIGTTTTGNATLGNGGPGIYILSTTPLTIGGTVAAARNVIGGNGNGGTPKFPGILLEGAAAVTIQGNNIGLGADGTSNVGNIGNGIDATSNSTGNTIGASTSGGAGGNNIAFNGAGRTNGAGVGVAQNNNGNKMLSNSIFSNTGTSTSLGIDLSAGGSATDGPTANDACDSDAGGNNLQNFPVLTGAASTGSTINMIGTLNSTASTTFTLEFFQNSSGSQGRTFIGSTTTTTNGACAASFNATIPATVSAGVNITATATDPSGNTSEFSAAFVSTATPTAANSRITGRIADNNGQSG
jgi:hypothetical protein